MRASHPPARLVRTVFAIAVSLAVGLGGVACTKKPDKAVEHLSEIDTLLRPLVENGSTVLADADGTGIDASGAFFETSDSVVVSAPSRDAQLKAAGIAVDFGAPMLIHQPGAEDAVEKEISRLGAQRRIQVSSEDPVDTSMKAETDAEDLALIDETVAVDAGDGHGITQIVDRGARATKESKTPVFATESTSLAAAATATAKHIPVTVLSYPDPRVTRESMDQVKGKKVLALGQDFGSSEYLNGAVDMAANGELPGGGGLVFPGRRMIALYGHPSGPALGQMGEQPPAEAVQVVQKWVDQYREHTDETIVPAFEVIATVASAGPGDDGNFTNETDPADLVPYIDAITEAGGYAVIDLQPGLDTFKDQAVLYEELLKRPNVGLALDAEWKLQPGQTPAAQVGSADAAEINEVTQWLADLTRKHKLPQKALIVHQFQVAMLPDRHNINTDHPELSFILHADGHGTPGEKFDTWNILLENLDPRFFVAWKNFIDEDKPMFTPEQTYTQVNPRPWFVSYQ